MLLKHYVDRYNIYFAYRPSKINRRIHTTAINFVITSLFILQMMLLVYIVLRAGALLLSPITHPYLLFICSLPLSVGLSQYFHTYLIYFYKLSFAT